MGYERPRKTHLVLLRAHQGSPKCLVLINSLIPHNCHINDITHFTDKHLNHKEASNLARVDLRRAGHLLFAHSLLSDQPAVTMAIAITT